jgi:hypothetical protein
MRPSQKSTYGPLHHSRWHVIAAEERLEELSGGDRPELSHIDMFHHPGLAGVHAPGVAC